jgi:hypothetical protein
MRSVIQATLFAFVQVLPVWANDALPKVEGLKDRLVVVCMEEQKDVVSVCNRPCATWAKSQSEAYFQASFETCVGQCKKERPCVGQPSFDSYLLKQLSR